MGVSLSIVRFTDLGFDSIVIPAMNRWATVIRPLRGRKMILTAR